MSARDLQRRKEKGLGRMIFVSALLHVFVVSGIVAGVAWQGPRVSAPISYTVKLVDPAAVDGTLSPGPLKASTLPPKKSEIKPSPPAKKEEAKKERSGKVELSKKLVKKEKPKEVKAKPVPKPSVNEKKAKKAESKKVKLSKAKKVKARPVPKTSKAMPPAKPLKKTLPSTPSAEELDNQYLAAINRIRRRVGRSASSALRPFDYVQGRLGSGQGSPGIGGESPGGGGVVREFEFLVYYNHLQNRVKESWIFTERKQGLSAVVRFGVRPTGEIFDVELVKPSGDRAFDQSVLRAVNKVNPLSPPPPAYQQEFAVKKVEITFGEKERSN